MLDRAGSFSHHLSELTVSQQLHWRGQSVTLFQHSHGADEELVYHLLRNCIVFVTRSLLKHVTAHQKIDDRGMKIPGQLKIEFRNVGGGYHRKFTLMAQFKRDNLDYALKDHIDVSTDKIIAAQAGIHRHPDPGVVVKSGKIALVEFF